ncbi:hypothetical protein ADUPG1_013943 [Aduncisulcus paluster]|uniref:Uncharacterized protein n=1 Tax=Aduncisulcus paluster TaxID=2918883 RepID=A0ABQ5K511_9EUKA|nr:hypothetical protein ADUPG1_013943 [Aduncisulcus paluster]
MLLQSVRSGIPEAVLLQLLREKQKDSGCLLGDIFGSTDVEKEEEGEEDEIKEALMYLLTEEEIQAELNHRVTHPQPRSIAQEMLKCKEIDATDDLKKLLSIIVASREEYERKKEEVRHVILHTFGMTSPQFPVWWNNEIDDIFSLVEKEEEGEEDEIKEALMYLLTEEEIQAELNHRVTHPQPRSIAQEMLKCKEIDATDDLKKLLSIIVASREEYERKKEEVRHVILLGDIFGSTDVEKEEEGEEDEIKEALMYLLTEEEIQAELNHRVTHPQPRSIAQEMLKCKEIDATDDLKKLLSIIVASREEYERKKEEVRVMLEESKK